MTSPIYQNFLGTWTLDVASCDYEQGDPPKSATYAITEDAGELVFDMNWIDADGETHNISFRAKPDGSDVPLNAGDLADTLSVTAASPQELNTSAFRKGFELMTAERHLSKCGTTMQVIQTVKLPDLTTPTNKSTFHRQQ